MTQKADSSELWGQWVAAEVPFGCICEGAHSSRCLCALGMAVLPQAGQQA